MFRKEDLDLVLDKRDEMINLAESTGVGIMTSLSGTIFCCKDMEELVYYRDLLNIAELKRNDWHLDEDYECKIWFEYRGLEFYHLQERSHEN